tara:strand:- start:307 stop:513 length:207 start_codon:yes stop_codon:yes gene_type:complete
MLAAVLVVRCYSTETALPLARMAVVMPQGIQVPMQLQVQQIRVVVAVVVHLTDTPVLLMWQQRAVVES